MLGNAISTQDCNSNNCINADQMPEITKNHRVNNKLEKVSIDVNQGNEQTICEKCCVNNYFVSYVKSTGYILTLQK